jgi:hypothetical protein
LFGPPRGAIINNWTKDQFGNIIGQTDGEQLCNSDGGDCQNLFWNIDLREWDGPGTPDQEAQACMTPFKNSKTGKAVSFFSVLSFFDAPTSTTEEWLAGGIAKTLYFGSMSKGANTAAGGISPVTTGLKWGLPKLANALVGTATLADFGVRSVCKSYALPVTLPSAGTGWE